MKDWEDATPYRETTETAGYLQAFRLLLLALSLCLATPVAAEETVTALGDRWYKVVFEPVQLPTPEGAWALQAVLCLEDIPGGIDGAPVVSVRLLTPAGERIPSGQGGKASLTLSTVGFAPMGPMPYVTVTLADTSGTPGSYQLKVHVRGKK